MERNLPDPEWLADIESSDEARVISALHQACPCTGDTGLYEGFMATLHRFKKDPRERVRKVAMHLERDAMEELSKADEVANGWVRNRPGGNGRRGETRRASARQGYDRRRPR